MEVLHSLFYFILAVSILVAFHEFGHFWVARRMGVKVIRFSIGFGRILGSFKKSPESTEYVISAIPLGGYVKMVDEREGEVEAADLPFAFNRQPVISRAAIVAAGPIFNLILAAFLFWCVLIIGETGIRPIIGKVDVGTLAYQAGLKQGDEILTVNSRPTPTWSEAYSVIYSEVMDGQKQLQLMVKNNDNFEQDRYLEIIDNDLDKPAELFKRIGLTPWSPELKAVIGKVLPDSAGMQAGLQSGDIILTADGVSIKDWEQWVDYVQERPGTEINLLLDRNGVRLPAKVIPRAEDLDGKTIGKIGVGVHIPEGLLEEMRITYSLSPLEAILPALQKTWLYSSSTLKMIGNMLIGHASVENLSGPISIAQYAGQSAEMGIVSFLKYLGLISISLGVLNLLPIPVLDGGHLFFFAIEAVKGSPISEKVQIYFQQLGIFLLISLMTLAMFLDIERLFQ